MVAIHTMLSLDPTAAKGFLGLMDVAGQDVSPWCLEYGKSEIWVSIYRFLGTSILLGSYIF